MFKTKGVAKVTAVIIAIVVVVAIGVGAWLATRAPAPPKSITIAWTEGPEFDFVEEHLSEFEAETGIDVKLEVIPRAHIIERLMLEMLAPTGKIHGTVLYCLELPTLAGTGGLVNLYDFKSKEEFEAEGHYIDQLETLEIGGKLYIIPGFWNGALITYYRKDYFEDPTWKAKYLDWPEHTMDELRVPTTPEELLEVAKFWDVVEDGEVNGIGPGGKYPIHIQATTAEMGAGAYLLFPPAADYFGGGIYDYETGEILADSPGTIEAMEYLIELTKYAQPTALVDGTFEAEIAIREGTVIMADQWTYMIPMLDDPDEMSPEAVGKYGISMRVMPQLPDMLGIAILDTPRKDMVWKFAEWVASPEIAAGLVLACPKAPERVQVAEDPEIAGAPWLDVILDSYGRVHPIVPLIKDPRAVEIYETMMRSVHEALIGDKTASEAMTALAADIEDIVKI